MIEAILIIGATYFLGFVIWLAYNTGKRVGEHENQKEVINTVFTEAYRKGYEQAVRDELTIHEHNLN